MTKEEEKRFPKLGKGDSQNFATLRHACKANALVLMRAVRRDDQKPVALVCAVNRVDGQYEFAPLAIMIEGDPYTDYEPVSSCEQPEKEKTHEYGKTIA